MGIMNTKGTRSSNDIITGVEPISYQEQGATNRCWSVRQLKARRRRRFIISEARIRRKSFYFHHVILKYINPSLLALVILKYQPSPNILFGKNVVPLCCFLVGIGLYGAIEYITTRNHKYFHVLSRFALSLVVLTTISLISMLVVTKHVSVVISTLLPLVLLVWPVLRLASTSRLLGKIKCGFNCKILEKLLSFKGGDDTKERASSLPV